MRRLESTAAACMLALASMLSGCGGTGPREQFYVLGLDGSVPTRALAAPASTAAPSTIFVGPVTVPESVDRSQMVLRTSANQVEIADFHRWAEPLKSAIPRVIAETLTRELGNVRVMSARQASGAPADQRVAVEIQRFDSSLDQGAAIEALWTVTPAKGAAKTGRSSVQEPNASRDAAGVAAAHSRALDRIGRDIAAVLRAP